jgi:hypothetical protein
VPKHATAHIHNRWQQAEETEREALNKYENTE